jgi:DNA segregation ATPase FtsK/SpoIIIE, S-DNA-T family
MTIDHTEKNRAVLAEVVAEIIRNQFKTNEDAKSLIIRVNFLRDPEIKAFLTIWQQRSEEFNLDTVKVVISSDPEELFPPEFVADTPITYYRNNNSTGLIYLENETTSDSQSLKNAFTLRDTDVLNGVVSVANYTSAEQLIVQKAWEVVSAGNTSASTKLSEQLIQIYKLLSINDRKIALRQFVEFAVNVAVTRNNIQEALSLHDINKLIGRCLVSLELFPDELWALDGSIAKISRRLFVNGEFAELYQPNGQPIDVDDLTGKISSHEFLDTDGQILGDYLQQQYREACINYCNNKSFIEGVPFFIFEQLFKKDTVGLKLGQKVKTEIEELVEERLSEYLGLNIIDGLDAKIVDEAQRFLDTEPDGSEEPLRDVISGATRRQIEKAASPTAKSIETPFLAISKVCETFSNSDFPSAEITNLYLRMSAIENDENEFTTLRLFQFLYSNSLQELVDLRSNNLDGFGFEISDNCSSYDAVGIEDRLSDYRDGNIDDELPWSPVALKFELIATDSNGLEKLIDNDLSFQWYPKNLRSIATYWLLALEIKPAAQLSRLELPKDTGFDRYTELVALGTLSPSTLKCTMSKNLDEVVGGESFKELQICATEISKNGLSVAVLQNATDHWNALSIELRDNHVPNGKAEPVLDDYLSLSILHTGSHDTAIMTPGHPIKQRWIASYLSKSIKFSEIALKGTMKLNPENPNFYIDWIFNTSPIQQPALVYGANESLLFSAKEHHWFETYIDLEADKSTSNNVDDNVVEIAIPEIKQYLQAYPHKSDGLSLLVALTGSPRFPTQLLSKLRVAEWSRLKVDLHVVANQHLWEKIRGGFEGLAVQDRLSKGAEIHPEIHLHLYDIDEIANDSSAVQDLHVDIAIRPQFFSERPQIEEETRRSSYENSVKFDPLLDKPTKMEVTASGNRVSVEQLPSVGDNLAESWSTIAVRQRRNKAVAPDNLDNTDFVKLTSNFGRETQLLNLLHRISHWVVTVEKNISRQYIESLEEQPSILAVKENLGSSGLFTMIISSNSGEDFSVQRLSRKIRRTFKCSEKLSVTLAVTVFTEAKSLTPSLALQAMGISRITEEILGLIIAKKLTERFNKPNITNGFSAWVSLDTHTEWFGGASTTRADLCRVDFDISAEGSLQVKVVILEAKFRQSPTNYGHAQIERTINLFEHFLEPTSARIDVGLWRNSLLDAINNCSADAVTFFGDYKETIKQNGGQIPPLIRDYFRSGNFELVDLSGFYSQAMYGQEGELTKQLVPVKDRLIEDFTTYSNHLTDILLDQFVDAIEPQNSHDDETGSAEFEKNTTQDQDTTRDNSENEQSDSDTDFPEVRRDDESPIDFKKLSEDSLRQRYQNIIDALSEYNIIVAPVKVSEEPYFEGPATVVFRLNLGSGVEPKAIFNKSDILKLKLGLEEEQNIRSFIDKGNVVIEVPKVESERYFVTAQQLWSAWIKPQDQLACPIGVDQRGSVKEFVFSSSNSPHLLIGGTTGSGKSEALNTILAGLTNFYPPQQLRLNLVDPKGTELLAYEGSKHLNQGIMTLDDEAIEMLEMMVGEMDNRYSILKSKRVNNLIKYNSLVPDTERLPWHLVVLDEYADLTSDPDAKKEIERHLKRLAQKARAAGIHVIIATQKPSAEVISTNLRSNLPAQLALKVKASEESRVIMGDKGAESLNGKGDAFLNAEGKILRIQCGYVP